MWWYKFLLVLGVLTFRMKLIEARIIWKMIGMLGYGYVVDWYESGYHYDSSKKTGINVTRVSDKVVYKYYRGYNSWNDTYNSWNHSDKSFEGLHSSCAIDIFIRACVRWRTIRDDDRAKEAQRKANLALRKSQEEILQRLQK